MKDFLKKDWPLLLLISLPPLYLARVWGELPQRVPVHYNLSGEADRYGDKSELWWLALLLPSLTYLLMLAAPYIDPKKRLQNMEGKYQNLKTILTVAMSALAIFMIYLAGSDQQFSMNYLVLGLGALFMFLGNYFKTIRPNYFIGIKTPWTLENETVWKDTHKLAGKYWFAGGLLIIIAGLLFEQHIQMYVLFTVTLVITLIPVIYSYRRFRQLE
ncbi:SdpI family protein [Robertkochia aurantiaca]|uniref:SdpI family protein n=1 Tax=Robertkochia aurantiaca TaxID=2873700 RepID=UPI001CCBD2C2|nr:SdpI family protein [Robertkochia sp. 3YJGBD-33]